MATSREYCTISARCVLAALLAVTACEASARAGTVIVVHEGGKQREFSISTPAGRAVLEGCERALRRADDVLRLAVSAELVRELRERETSIEIVYATPQTWKLEARQGRELTARRLLIPLSGELAGDVTTILYDGGDGYAAGPLRAQVATAELERLVRPK